MHLQTETNSLRSNNNIKMHFLFSNFYHCFFFYIVVCHILIWTLIYSGLRQISIIFFIKLENTEDFVRCQTDIILHFTKKLSFKMYCNKTKYSDNSRPLYCCLLRILRKRVTHLFDKLSKWKPFIFFFYKMC